MKKLTYFMVAAVFLGAQLFAIDLGIMKLSMFRISLLLMGIGLIISVVQNNPSLKFYPYKISSIYVTFFGIWFLYGLVSLIWVASIGSWLRANYFIGIGFFSIFTIHQFIKTKEDVVHLLQVVAGALLFHTMIGWSEIITGYYHFADLAKLDRYNTFSSDPMSRIPISIYANQNDYATMLTAGIFLTGILFMISKKKSWKFGYGALILAALYLIIRTDSRANVLGLAIGLGFILLAKFSEIINLKRIVIMASTAVTSLLILYFGSSAFQRITNNILLRLLDTANVTGNSNSTRLNLIRNGFMFLGETFGFGVGAGNIEYWMEHEAVYNIATKYNMHNWWMEILTGYGLWIFIGYVTLYIFLIIRFMNYYKYSSDRFVKVSSIIIIGYLGAFILASISSSALLISEWQWVIFGVLIAILSYCEKNKTSEIKQVYTMMEDGING